VNFAAITLCVAFERVFIVIVYFVIDSVRKLLDAVLSARCLGYPFTFYVTVSKQ
jgi:hypothetical protein